MILKYPNVMELKKYKKENFVSVIYFFFLLQSNYSTRVKASKVGRQISLNKAFHI